MTESIKSQTDGPTTDQSLTDELAATQQAFESIGLPGITRRRLGPTAEDIGAYLELDDLAFFQENHDTPTTHQPDHFTEDDVKEAMAAGAIFEGIFDGQDRLIASMWLNISAEDDELEIANIQARPEYRDQGIGTYFLAAAEQIAEMRGLGQVGLHVDPLNSRGMHLYNRSGFEVTGYEHDNEGGLQDWLIMTKPLSAEPKLKDATTMIHVKTGDEESLARVIADGYIGVGFNSIHGSADPTNNLINFVKVAD